MSESGSDPTAGDGLTEQQPGHHGRPPGHHEQENWNTQLASLERDGRISMTWIPAAIAWILSDVDDGEMSHIVDAGSGPGFAAFAFAAALPASAVTALDPEPLFVQRVEERARDLGVADRVTTLQGDIETGFTDIAPADLIWCSHVLHHLPDPVAAIRALGAALAPSGRLAVVEGGLPTRVLPGGHGVSTPGFVLRLEATLSDYFLEKWHMPVSRGETDWPVLLRLAGLEPLESKTFLTDIRAPVDDAVRQHIVGQFEGMRDLIGGRLDDSDTAALDRLLDPDDDAALANRDDLFLLGASTVHLARRG